MRGLLRAFLWRDAAMERVYRFNLAVKALSLLFQIVLFYYVSRALSPAYFPFVLTGLLFSRFFQFWAGAFAESIRQEQYFGTAETIFLAPCHPLQVIIASTAGKALLLLLECAAAIAFVAVLFPVPTLPHPTALLLVPLHALLFGGWGLAAAGFVMRFKRGDPVSWAALLLFDILSGVYFPVAVLPIWLRDAAVYLPTTQALDAWRAVLSGAVPPHLPAQCVWAIASAATGAWAFMRGLAGARRRGAVGSY